MKISVDQTYEFKEKCMEILDGVNDEINLYGESDRLFTTVSGVFIAYTMMIDDAGDDSCMMLQEDLLEVGKYCREMVDRQLYNTYDEVCNER